MTLDPSAQSNPPLRMLAWNPYLGERRSTAPIQQQPGQLTDILSETEMQRLAAIYLDKVQPCYGFVDRSIQAVRSSIAAGLPWHHVANIPFQAVCTLLTIDTAPSFALLAESLACLEAVDDAYQTGATLEAVTAAHALVQLHRKRREAQVRKQSEMLSLYPAVHYTPTENSRHVVNGPTMSDSWWYNEFMADFDLNTT